MTDYQTGYLKALSDMRAWHRIKLNEAMGEPIRVRMSLEASIAFLDLMIETKRRHAEEDGAEGLEKRFR